MTFNFDAVREINKTDSTFQEDFLLAALVWQEIDEQDPSNNFDRTIVQQSRVAWRLFESAISTISLGYGISSVIIARSLFEYVVGIRYLISQRHDDEVLQDFYDHGRKTLYEIASPIPEFASTYRMICLRLGKNGKWHRHKNIHEFSKAAKLDDLYSSFYKQTSSVVHGDSLVILMEGTQGLAEEHCAEIGLAAIYMLTAFLLRDVAVALGLDCKRELLALDQASLRRLKAFEIMGNSYSGRVQ